MLENLYGKSRFLFYKKLKSVVFLRQRDFFAVFLASWGEKGALFARWFPYSVSWFPYCVGQRNKAVGG